MFVEVFSEEAGKLLLDRRLYFARDELVLRLRRELRIVHFHRNDGRETFARIVTCRRDVQFLRETLALDVLVQRPRQSGTEAREVRAAIALRNVVGVRENLFLKAIVPLHRDFDADAIVALLREVEDLVQ